MASRVKVFSAESCGCDIGFEEHDPEFGNLEESINSWAQQNRVRILSASIAPYSENRGNTDSWVAIVVYEG